MTLPAALAMVLISTTAQAQDTESPPTHTYSAPLAATVEGRQRTIERFKKLEAQLDAPLSNIIFENLPLQDAVDALERQTDIRFVIDEKALAIAGVSPRTDVSLITGKTEISVRDVFRLMTQHLDVALINDNGFAVITSDEAAANTFVVRVYNVRDFVDDGSLQQRLGFPDYVEFPFYRDIENSIQQLTPGPWMNIDGRGGSLAHFDGLLIINHNMEIHREISSVLHDLRALRSTSDTAEEESHRSSPVSESLPRRELTNVERKLDMPVTPLAFDDVTLSEMLQLIGGKVGLTFRIDPLAIKKNEIDPTQRFSLRNRTEAISARDIFRLVTREYALELIDDGGIVTVTTEERAKTYLKNRVYNIDKLVADAATSRGVPPRFGGIGGFIGPYYFAWREVYPDTEFRNALQLSIDAPWMAVVGVGGDVVPVGDMLVIRHTEAVHRRVEDLIRQIDEADRARGWSKDFPKKPTAAERAAAEKYNAEIIAKAKCNDRKSDADNGAATSR
ncbi:hypothetical protein [Stratiformator vulcanicus]|uniref:Uncharacterized protein n=1 Tax=Stratiformator vulcanicus TaxID=2527980 RepID=A0A517R369_9PLAN|nr:hypothetical protein [Stratiformator vulcanicus]QDT38329.1 hypothetical protein Pan189_27200 [Stratiformator vulcanicus]